MNIGSVKLENNLVLAPMAGVTDRPFRQLCRKLGAGLAVSEMVTVDTTLWGSRKSLSRLNHHGETGPIAVQIVGNDPGKMAAAARINSELGAQIVDINMGCPAKKVCKAAAGSALMQDENLVARILEQTVNAVDIPVTVKIRTGWDNDNRNAVAIAQIAEASGIAAISVHGRTRADKFSGNAEYETIRSVKQSVSIPVIANGDIDSPQKAARVLNSTNADGIMIGRAAQGSPWIFTHIDHYLRTGESLPEPEPAWIRDLLLEHLDELYSFYGSKHGVRIARKHIGWYSKSHPGGSKFRQAVFSTDNPKTQTAMVKAFFNDLRSTQDLAA